jgi:multiple sugar transport system substrate-binding protein
MSKPTAKQVGRRDFMTLAAGATVAGSLGLVSRRALAGRKTLRIAKWPHFVPEYDLWFETIANDWGQRNDTLVSIDKIPIEKLGAAATAEIRSGKGHDIFMFPSPPAQYYQHAIDHAGVYQAVAANYGAIPQLAFRSTFYPRTKKYFAFSDFWMPAPLHFFQDRWAEVGMPLGPISYTDLRAGGRKLRAQSGIPCGLAFSPTLEGNVTLHTMLYAFRAWVMDASGNALFDTDVFAVSALKYIQALYKESGDPQQLVWAPAGNVQAMLAHKTSATINAISLMRAAERQAPQLAGKIRLKPPLLGTNGMGVTALPHVTNCSVIWNFSRNQEAAVQFLAGLVDTSRTGYEKSLGCNFPIYPKTVPDLIVRLSKDPYADPGYKYVELKDALHWTPNLGVPGFATPAYMEVFNSSLIPKMVRSVLQGEHTPEDAAAIAAREIQRVITKWEEV